MSDKQTDDGGGDDGDRELAGQGATKGTDVLEAEALSNMGYVVFYNKGFGIET